MRVFDYRGTLDITKALHSDDGIVSANVTSQLFYGDGRAKATATFENGLIRYPGVYLNSDGQPSSDKKIQDSEKYHNFSYLISSQTDYAKFKKPLIVSTGMNDISSVKKTVQILKKSKIKFALLHCTSMYPTPYEKVRLGGIKDLIKNFNKIS